MWQIFQWYCKDKSTWTLEIKYIKSRIDEAKQDWYVFTFLGSKLIMDIWQNWNNIGYDYYYYCKIFFKDSNLSDHDDLYNIHLNELFK